MTQPAKRDSSTDGGIVARGCARVQLAQDHLIGSRTCLLPCFSPVACLLDRLIGGPAGWLHAGIQVMGWWIAVCAKAEPGR